jgi:aspartate-semialdehyde dehydrogenase
VAPVSVDAARAALVDSPGISVIDNPATLEYPMPGKLAGSDDVYVGRLRIDDSVEHGLAFWCVADQLRKGAALNAVQIAELLLNA